MKNLAILGLFIAVVTSQLAYANYANYLNRTVYTAKSIEACENRNLSLKELSSCLDVVQAHTEKELQTWVNNQTYLLEDFAKATGRTAPLRIFKQSQKDFLRYRESNCLWQHKFNSPGLSGPPASKKCVIYLNTNRINELSQLPTN